LSNIFAYSPALRHSNSHKLAFAGTNSVIMCAQLHMWDTVASNTPLIYMINTINAKIS